jgi:hypothetical protein
MAKLGWTVRIAQGRRVEHCAMDGPKDITEGYFRGRPSEHVTAFLATHAASDALRLEFNENLDQIIGGHTLERGEVFDSKCFLFRIMAGKSQDGAGGVIAFHRQLHTRRLTGHIEISNGV